MSSAPASTIDTGSTVRARAGRTATTASATP
jgi:hypothetical protein